MCRLVFLLAFLLVFEYVSLTMSSFFTKRYYASNSQDEEKIDTVAFEKDGDGIPDAPVIGKIDPVIAKRVRRKLDKHVVPLLAALYLLAFLDRSNIG